MGRLTAFRGFRFLEKHSLMEVLYQTFAPLDVRRTKSISDVEHEAFILNDAPDLYDEKRNSPHQQGEITGFILQGGVLWPGCGAVRTADGSLIEESYPYAEQSEYARKRGYLKRFPLLRYKGAVATIGSVYRNYYHRISDSITRVHGLYHPALSRLDGITLCVDQRFSASEIKLIQRLIPDNVKLDIVPYGRRVAGDYCIHLPYLSSDRVGASKWFESSVGFVPQECLEWIRSAAYDVFDVQPRKPHRRIFVTRRNAKVRRLVNEDEVVALLSNMGFDVLALETMPMREQVRAFAEAEIVVAQHGAGLTNLLFAQQTAILEIMSDKDEQIFFRLLSESRGFDHIQIHLDGKDKNADVRLPLERLGSGLRELGIEI